MYGNTGVGDGSGSNKIVRVNSRGELMDGWIATLQSEEVVDDSDKTFTVPAGTEWEILSIYVEYISTATAGNRQVAIRFTDGADDIIGQVRAGIAQAASLTRFYQFGVGLADLTAFRDTDFLMTPLPRGLVLPAGYKVRVFDKAAIAAAADDMDVQMIVKARLVP